MNLLLHICCAPCTVYTVKKLRCDGYDICGFFYNPNIHPYSEYKKRFATVEEYAGKDALRVIFSEDYTMEEFLRNVAFREKDRCLYCYYDRLRRTALTAKKEKFKGFTSTMLYSKYQRHEMIKSVGENIAEEVGIPFHYHDFREGWIEGIRSSKEMGLYRQSYCGCIYSEKERFFPVKA
jgi:predicted adenine nucleotide alpha hydrolase (AANH) superfamily ATPase